MYRIVREPPSEFALYRDPGEVRVANLESGRSEPLVRGFQALDYDISADGRQVVMETADREGKPRLWLAPMDRSSPPHQIPNVVGGSPRFGPGGEIFFRRRAEASFRRKGWKAAPGLFTAFAPTGLECGRRSNKRFSSCGRFRRTADGSRHGLRCGQRPPSGQAFSLDGKPPVRVGWVGFGWVPGGALFVPFFGNGDLYCSSGTRPDVAANPGRRIRFRSEGDIASLPGARKLPVWPVGFGPSPDVYAFYHGTIQRNLYRIPIP